MIIIVDGYNVLKRQHEITFVDDALRRSFIHQIAGYVRKSGNKVMIIFDGEQNEDRDEKYGRNVQVIYSGSRETADDYIMRYIEKHANKDLILVTSDRELNQLADRYEVPSLDSHDFMNVLKYSRDEQLGTGSDAHAPIVKISQKVDPELDTLMEQASRSVPQKAEDVIKTSNYEHAQKMSKKERALLKKIKKL